MNNAHWHLVLNHLPIIFPMVGFIVLLTGFIAKSEAVKRTGFFIFCLGALTTIGAMTTGEGAEEIVEKMQNVSEKLIKTHEEAAELFGVLTYILAGISLIGLWASFTQKSFSNACGVIVIILSAITLFFAKETGATGGQITHSEIRSEVGISNASKSNEASDNANDETMENTKSHEESSDKD